MRKACEEENSKISIETNNKSMAKVTKKEAEEETEVYLKYVMNVTTMTINVQSGGTLIMQSGSATPPPVPPKP